MPESSVLQIAYHEAGHAIVGHALGGTIRYVVFNPDRYDTCVNIGDFRGPFGKSAGLLAGALGQYLAEQDIRIPPWFDLPPEEWPGAYADAREIRLSLAELSPPMEPETATAFLEGAKLVAWRILLANRELLDALSQRFMNKKRMEGSEVIEVITVVGLDMSGVSTAER